MTFRNVKEKLKPLGKCSNVVPNIEEIMKIIVEEGENRFTSAGNPKTWTLIKKENITVVHVVSTLFALKAQNAGVDDSCRRF
jgi:hypothetical protein